MEGQRSSTNKRTINFDNGLNSNNPGLFQLNGVPVNTPDHCGFTSMGSNGSSSTMNSPGQVNLGDSSLERGCLFSLVNHTGTGQRLEGRNSGLTFNGPSALHASGSYAVPQVNLNVAYQGNDGYSGQVMGSETLEHVVEEVNPGLGSSGGEYRCNKRKIPEKAPGQLPFCGNSSSTRQVVIPDSQQSKLALMEGQRSSTNKRTINFDNGLNSNNPGLFQLNGVPVNTPDHCGFTSMGSNGSSSTMNSPGQVNLGDSSLERGCLFSLVNHTGTGQRLEGRNSGLTFNGPSALHASGSYAVPQVNLNVAYQGNDGYSGQVMGSETLEHVVEEVNPGLGSSCGEYRCNKRKIPEKAPGQLPFCGNSSSTRQVVIPDSQVLPTMSNFAGSAIPYTSRENLLNPNHSGQVTHRLGSVMAESESYMHGASREVRNTESFHRNIRQRRIENHQDLLPANAFVSGNSVINSPVELPGQTSIVSQLDHSNSFPGHIASTLRSGSTVAPPGFAQHQVAEGSSNGTSAGFQLSSGLPGLPWGNNADRYTERLSDIVVQSRTTLTGSNYGAQGGNNPEHSINSPTEQTLRAARRGDVNALQSLLTPGLFMTRFERHNAPPIPREQRNIDVARRGAMLVFEIRRVLDLLRRSDPVQDEFYREPEEEGEDDDEEDDVLEDMHFDVDDMSYEQLLALGNQIGNVSCGVNKDTIFTHLKRCRYQSGTAGPQVDRPRCCICLDGYINGQGVGNLDCGHDFHFHCIRDWLLEKNCCPLCKRTALPKD
ncbi:unnamed protein product [Ilex paraguariensis]|uniref:RING-type E3 ubiquitin transferase n=1 Tax=Ilex paraguariensis TaxID=185542 RepID=A0ABC8TG82_9AQUA